MVALDRGFLDRGHINKKVWRAKEDLEFARDARRQLLEIEAQEREDFEHRLEQQGDFISSADSEVGV